VTVKDSANVRSQRAAAPNNSFGTAARWHCLHRRVVGSRLCAARSRRVNSGIGRLPSAEESLLNLGAFGIVVACKEVKEGVLSIMRHSVYTGA
jgi:hypothetical protein